jgi:hypothetical protein
MTRDLGWLQRSILDVLRSDPARVWLYVDVAREVYGPDCEPMQRQALQNAFRSLARRGLVALNPPNCFTEWGRPEARDRAKALQSD